MDQLIYILRTMLDKAFISKKLIEKKVTHNRRNFFINNFNRNEVYSKCCMILTYLTCVISKVAAFYIKIKRKKTSNHTLKRGEIKSL